MYNLFKILAIGIAVIKARISFQLVLMMPLFYMLVATWRGFQCDRHLHSVHIPNWAAAYKKLLQEKYFGEEH